MLRLHSGLQPFTVFIKTFNLRSSTKKHLDQTENSFLLTVPNNILYNEKTCHKLTQHIWNSVFLSALMPWCSQHPFIRLYKKHSSWTTWGITRAHFSFASVPQGTTYDFKVRLSGLSLILLILAFTNLPHFANNLWHLVISVMSTNTCLLPPFVASSCLLWPYVASVSPLSC